ADSLMVVDTEISASKQSQSITRDVAYDVDLAHTSGPTAQVTITYTNASQPKSYVTYISNYRTFVRVYAPPGAVLVGTDGLDGQEPLNTSECGRTVFGGDVAIPRGSGVHVSFRYTLPAQVVAGGNYDLLVQPQPGVPPGHVAVTVRGADNSVASITRENSPG